MDLASWEKDWVLPSEVERLGGAVARTASILLACRMEKARSGVGVVVLRVRVLATRWAVPSLMVRLLFCF